MYIRNANTSYLDQIRLKNGAEKLKAEFVQLAEADKEKALASINDEKLLFCSLYTLLPEIETLNLYDSLNERNRIAIKMCAKILKDKVLAKKMENLNLKEEIIPSVLNWIFNTGAADDGLCDDYDEILDSSASLLVHTYEDRTILPMIADMIFKRNRKGCYIHDLVWVFFKACDLKALKHIARYLRSANQKDNALARQLLNFVPDKSKNKRFSVYLKENTPFLYYTGESFLQTSDPKPFRIDLGAKYLGKDIDTNNREPVEPLTENECSCLEYFKDVDEENRLLLSQYSHQLHKRNMRYWEKWMQYPLEQQIDIAKRGLGGRR